MILKTMFSMVHFSEKKHPYIGASRFSTELIVLPQHQYARMTHML